ncbi:PREDICTED: uncharacterized protein LOC106744636 [Dinoponera quadriceps]|uniref:Uncharacterized protein LOC106744636 n=1 Tax=Dinoponera quadriceps TaxID=609295 RepID=A0A6P3XAY2_DINQU|nr:PREDICTED: uncharacterized protein LOC106744636 [Dinoponera quadriceps]
MADNVFSDSSTRLLSSVQRKTVDELEKECLTLRRRVKELTERSRKENVEQIMLEIAELKHQNAALEAVFQGNVTSQLEKLEMTKDILEMMNLKLESENLELRLALERSFFLIRTLRGCERKYMKLLKAEKSSDS